MKATPYELVFHQPPQQNISPGVKGERIMEEDVEDFFDKEDDCESGVSGGDKLKEIPFQVMDLKRMAVNSMLHGEELAGGSVSSDGTEKDGC